jgi:hypothetical protein
VASHQSDTPEHRPGWQMCDTHGYPVLAAAAWLSRQNTLTEQHGDRYRGIQSSIQPCQWQCHVSGAKGHSYTRTLW